MHRGLSTVALMVTCGILGPASTSRADTFAAPSDVAAQADGSFSYQCVFTKGAGADLLGGYQWVGLENVTGGVVADCFCQSFCALAPGERVEITVQGQLIEPQLPGLVDERVFLCASGDFPATTVVHPYPAASVPGLTPAEVRFSNEPNPFSARTTFRYTVPEPGPVRLRVYDLAGRLVATVVDEIQAAGPHRVTWDGASLRLPGPSGGILFARLSIGAAVVGRTLVLVR